MSEIPTAIREPLHRRVRGTIDEGIFLAWSDPRAALPSTRGLALNLGVSRNTVNTAYQELLPEGCIVSRPRSRVFVDKEVASHPAPEPRTTSARTGVLSHERLRPEHGAGMPKVAKRSDWPRYPYPRIPLHRRLGGGVYVPDPGIGDSPGGGALRAAPALQPAGQHRRRRSSSHRPEDRRVTLPVRTACTHVLTPSTETR